VGATANLLQGGGKHLKNFFLSLLSIRAYDFKSILTQLLSQSILFVFYFNVIIKANLKTSKFNTG